MKARKIKFPVALWSKETKQKMRGQKRQGMNQSGILLKPKLVVK